MAVAAVDTPKAAVARFLASLHRPSHILVAISGGSDSVGLLMVLDEGVRSGPYRHTLSAATIDHGLRTEAAAEARSVSALCDRLGIAHRILRWEGPKPEAGLMAAAREARYVLLGDAAATLSADLIVTGHTWDDQQETLTMRAARVPGDRVDAATGIAEAVLFDRRVWVVRPFLACRRADIRADLVGRGMGWIDDPSNADDHYERVRVRTRLADDGGSALPADGGGTRSDLAVAAARWVAESVAIYADVLCRIDRQHFDAGSPALAYGLSYLTAVLGGKPFGPGRVKLQNILAFIGHGQPGRRTCGGVVFDIRREGLYLMRESRNIAELRLPGGARGVWDGRFDVANNSRDAVQIIAAGSDAPRPFPDGTPGSVAARAAASAPHIRLQAADGLENAGAVTITPRLAPFDRFLTRFDLTFADRLATSFGREAYLPPPL